MASVWGELKRRNVVKVAVAYAIVGWLLVEIASTVLPTFDAPRWALQTITFVILLGFPLSLVFAWAFELTPEGLKKEKDVDRSESITHQTSRKLDFLIIAVLGIAVIYFVAGRFFFTDEGSTLGPAVIEQSVAVLPLVNMSADPEQEYFSDGIAEELLNQLSKIHGLQVAGRTSSFAFKGQNEDLRVIGEKLNVAHILEGSVRKAGDRVRITVQLIKASDGFHLWSETYDRDLTDIFAIQEDIAKAVANVLSITLGVGQGDLGIGGTRNFEAYDAYLAGISSAGRLEEESTFRAIEQLQKAVALDPDYAQAWGALAQTYWVAATFFPGERTQELYGKSDAAASRAVEIAPEAVASLLAAAQLHRRNHEWTKEEQALQKALRLAPTDSVANQLYGTFLLDVGRPRDAIDYYQQAGRTEPLLLTPVSQLGRAYTFNNEFDLALKEYERGKELIGNQSFRNIFILILGMQTGDRMLMEETLDHILADEDLAPFQRQLTATMASQLDAPEAAKASLHRFYDDPTDSSPLKYGAIATWASYVGDYELALQTYRELFETTRFETNLLWRPLEKEMRRLPGFKDLVRDLGLVDYWRETGNWSEFCRPLGHADIECN